MGGRESSSLVLCDHRTWCCGITGRQKLKPLDSTLHSLSYEGAEFLLRGLGEGFDNNGIEPEATWTWIVGLM